MPNGKRSVTVADCGVDWPVDDDATGPAFGDAAVAKAGAAKNGSDGLSDIDNEVLE